MVDKKLWDTQTRYFSTNENPNQLTKIIRTQILMYFYQKTVNILLISMMNKKSLAVQVQASLQRETLGKRNGV